MAIHPDDSVRKPKGPVTITGVDTGTQIVVSDYLGAGRAARFIKSNDSSATNFLGVRINSLTINYKENNGLVGTPVKIWLYNCKFDRRQLSHSRRIAIL